MGGWIQEVKIAELKPVPVVKSKLEEHKEGFLRNIKFFCGCSVIYRDIA